MNAAVNHKCFTLILSSPTGSGQVVAAQKGYENNEKSKTFFFSGSEVNFIGKCITVFRLKNTRRRRVDAHVSTVRESTSALFFVSVNLDKANSSSPR